jgi:ribosomal protein S6--L-glutamate ligase
LIRTSGDLPAAEEVAGVYYLQRYVAGAQDGVFRDFRVFVCQGRVIAAMVRHATSWVTNVKRGGRPMAGVIGGEIKDLAVRAAAAVGAAFAGVDLILSADGHPAVLEVNSMPAWAGLQKVTPTNIAATLAADLMAALDSRLVHEARA